jgi:tetratricopeptide (TPR) repeat protein
MTKDTVNNNSNKTLLIVTFLLFAYIANFFMVRDLIKPGFQIGPQETTVHFDENLVKALSFGQYRLTSSILWAETLLRSDIKRYDENDLNNWMFHRLNLITTLDPYFYVSYLYGAVYLSIIKDDLRGASTIYEKGLRIFPDDFDLNYNAAFHYYFEMGDYQKASQKLSKIIDHPRSSEHLKRIYSRVKAERGNLEDAFEMIKGLYEKSPEGSAIKERYGKSLFQIKTELDLKCLNNGESNCSRVNIHGRPYIIQDGRWQSPEEWKPFRVKKRPSKY